MKYHPDKAFPHPVLSDYADDYVGKAFQVFPHLFISPDEASIKLEAKFDLSEPELKKLIQKKKAQYAIHVVCSRTFYRKLLISPEKELHHEFERGDLQDMVELTGCIVSTADHIPAYKSKNFNSEFGNESFDLNSGSVLAVSEPQKYYCDTEHMKPFGTVFRLQAVDNMKQGLFKFTPDEEKITIFMSPKDKARFDSGRQQPSMRPFLLMSVYFPVLTEVLREMQADSAQYEERKWHRAITSRLEKDGISIDSGEPYEMAQKLLNLPLSKLPLDVE